MSLFVQTYAIYLLIIAAWCLLLAGCVSAPRVIQREELRDGRVYVQECRQRVVRSEIVSETCGEWRRR